MNLFGDDPLIFFGNLIALVITILVLFYAFGDGPPFRIAIYIFVGVSAGYVGGVTWHSIIRPQLIDPLLHPETSIIPRSQLYFTLLLVGLLVTKLWTRTAILGNPVSAFIVGIGAATAIGGAIQGTLIPLSSSTHSLVSADTVQLIFKNISAAGLSGMQFLFTMVYMIGTISTLMYFHFSAKTPINQTPQRNRLIQLIANLGKLFIAVTFGVIFAGAIIASLDALIERLQFVWSTGGSIIFGR